MWKESIQKKNTINIQFNLQRVRTTFILFKCQRTIGIIILSFIFLFCCEKAHDNKEFSHENSKPGRESQITTR